MGGAEPAGGDELGRGHVDGDYPLGPGDPRSLDAVEADAADTDDDGRGAGTDPCRVEHGTDTGEDGAADEAGPVELDPIRQRDHLGCVHGHLLGERCSVHCLIDGLPVRSAEHCVVGRERAFAQRRLTDEASSAPPAGAHECDGDTVAGVKPDDSRAHHFGDPGRLVSVDGRQRAVPCPIGISDVTVADCAGGETDGHLVLARAAQLHLLDAEGLAEAVADGCPHAALIVQCGPWWGLLG